MRKRNTTIAIRCTEEESRRIHEFAERHGLRLNDFVMRSALGKKIVVANGITDLYGLGIDFKKIAIRLLAVYCGFRDICPCIKQGHSFYP